MLVTISDRKIMMLPDDQGCTAGTANDILNVYTRNNEPSYVARQEVNLLDGFESINDDDFVAYTDNSLGACPAIDAANPPAGSYYRADIITANDYYPGGMDMPGRSYPIANTNYRYGFNGKEKDKESPVQYDYGFRIYDPRLVRFKSVDPLTRKYAELTPYQFASNTPIQAIDLDGLEKYIVHYKIENGCNIILKVVTDNSLKYLGGPTFWDQPTIHPKVAQYIQEDKSGKILNTTGEIPLKNFGSTLYVGAFNPKYGKEDGPLNGTYRYDYPAINSLDLAAKHHDLAYDKVRAAGPGDAIIDLETIDADKQLVSDAATVIKRYYLNQKDPVNKQPISVETKDAAVKVVTIFSAIVIEKTARIKANEAVKAIEGTWDKIKENINGAIKEGTRRLTPTIH